MRHLIVSFLSLIVFFSCANTKTVVGSTDSNTLYLVKKIEKKNSWYVIYTERNDTIYKIVSKNDGIINKDCKKIVVGESYNLELKSGRQNIPVINGIELNPVTVMDVMCYHYEEDTIICTDRKNGIYDLYYARNLKGLCIMEE